MAKIPTPTCNICGKENSHPFRVYDLKGKVLMGCVDKFHTNELITLSESSFWHNRKKARHI